MIVYEINEQNVWQAIWSRRNSGETYFLTNIDETSFSSTTLFTIQSRCSSSFSLVRCWLSDTSINSLKINIYQFFKHSSHVDEKECPRYGSIRKWTECSSNMRGFVRFHSFYSITLDNERLRNYSIEINQFPQTSNSQDKNSKYDGSILSTISAFRRNDWVAPWTCLMMHMKMSSQRNRQYSFHLSRRSNRSRCSWERTFEHRLRVMLNSWQGTSLTSGIGWENNRSNDIEANISLSVLLLLLGLDQWSANMSIFHSTMIFRISIIHECICTAWSLIISFPNSINQQWEE